MNLELVEDYKKELFENINSEFKNEGNLTTFIQIVGKKDGFDKPVIVHIVTGFANDEEKEFFINEAVPDICKRLKNNKIIPSFVTFVSECWMTMVDKKTKKEKKKEIVLITYSSEKGDDSDIYNIVRHPYEINEKGDLVSEIELEKNDELSTTEPSQSKGRFTNLYSRFMKHLNND